MAKQKRTIAAPLQFESTTTSGHAKAQTPVPVESAADIARKEFSPAPQDRSGEQAVTFVGWGSRAITLKSKRTVLVRFPKEHSYRYTTSDEEVIAILRAVGCKEIGNGDQHDDA